MLMLHDAGSGYEQEILHNVTIELAPGELVSLIGENGCGKTTLLRTLAQLLPLSAGQLEVDGKSAKAFDAKGYARLVSYLPQARPTPQLSVSSLVAHGRFPHLNYPRRLQRCDREKIDFAIETLHLSDYRERNLEELSGGERQRVYLAMMLAQDAKYMLLDEPTTYLDIRHQFEILSYLRRFADEGHGILMTLHDIPSALNHSDRVVVMSGGKIIADDTPERIAGSDILQKVFGVRAVTIQTEDKPQYIISPV